MTTHEKLAQEAAQLLAHIREDTARADALDPDNPPARSSAQRPAPCRVRPPAPRRLLTVGVR
ncbi:hypothetical protein [Streptomyces sp. NPDC056323]|uniref:hypothetical protein n=1 Tax=Streptomyces sp. NPDC056323 TaxID=3345784 RepID=UPI0035E0379E